METPVDDNTITLENPIKRGETEIKTIELRKPNAGALRGISLTELLQMDTGALLKVLPRISNPTIHEVEANKMDPADLIKVGIKVAGFLLPKVLLQEAQTEVEHQYRH